MNWGHHIYDHEKLVNIYLLNMYIHDRGVKIQRFTIVKYQTIIHIS
jgi:hypothetical protein